MVYSSHKKFLPAMKALLENKNLKIDGFINPGHVSAITGTKVYEKFSFPQVIAGFEPMDVLLAISLLLEQILTGNYQVQNEYNRVVQENGNLQAQKLIEEVFETKEAVWRGLGTIKNSGLKIRRKYQSYDAAFVHRRLLKKFRKKTSIKPNPCKCSQILQGLLEPKDCPLFGKICQPENPQGPCMVSVEGSCYIEYKYHE
jgi:hydrogenase expression/formation protein HypD